jgi:hypothetical protein
MPQDDSEKQLTILEFFRLQSYKKGLRWLKTLTDVNDFTLYIRAPCQRIFSCMRAAGRLTAMTVRIGLLAEARSRSVGSCSLPG